MSHYKDYFKGKRITILGLGLLGRGLGDAIFLAERGAELIVTDLRDEKTLKLSLAKLRKFKNIKYVLGGHKLEDFRNRDFILKAAGVSLDSLYIAEARKNNIPIEMDASLFAKLAPEGVTLIGVTGTRGKTTTTSLLYQILKAAGKRVYLGGNIQGIATLPLLKKIKKGDYVVAELDSWQLQGFHEAKISPQVSVFTNFLDDHLLYYKGNTERYFEDKVAIFKYQKTGDTLIAGEKVAEIIGKSGVSIVGDFVVASARDIPTDWEPKILGQHNLENIAAARAAAMALGISDRVIKKAVEDFKAVSGRLEYLRTVRGIKIYNDNNATTPDATIAGLRALAPRKDSGQNQNRIILILGGTDKGLDMSKLVEEIQKHCKAVIFLKETGTEKLFVTYNAKREAPDKKTSFSLHATRYTLHKTPAYEMETLEDCVKHAMAMAKRDDIVLFSPAFASFGKWFKNEYDRGEQFVALVKKLKD